MDLEFLSKASSWANAAVVVFTVLAAVAGVVAWHFSSQYRDAKDAAFERFKLQSAVSIAESATRTAEATKRLQRQEKKQLKPWLRQLAQTNGPRLLSSKQVSSASKADDARPVKLAGAKRT